MKKLSLKLLLIGALSVLGLGFLGNGVNAQVWVHGDANFGDLQTTWVWVAGADTEKADESFIAIVKNFINRVLAILWLIALGVLLRGGFQMVTAAGDEEKYKTGFKILKQAAMWLAFIWISFFIVSIIFSVLNTVTSSGTA